jgi:hypothetical protein
MSKLRKAAQDRAKGGEEDTLHCAEICANPATIATGTRVMADQAKLHFVDGNMHEYTQEEVHQKSRH